MTKTAVFPGTFDPFTLGHEDVIHKAQKIFGKIHIAIGINTNKTHLFSLEQRLAMIKHLYNKDATIIVSSFEGLTTEFCKKIEAPFIIRGIRNTPDFEHEKSILEMNEALDPELETIFLTTKPNNQAISSTIVREIYKSGGPIEAFVPMEVAEVIKGKV